MKRNTTYTRVTNIPASVYEEARQRAKRYNFRRVQSLEVKK